MTDRSLEALGFTAVPLDHPLSYPGRPVTGPALLVEGELWPLAAEPGSALGGWPVDSPGCAAQPLDDLLTRLGQAPVADRRAVIAVGSNASPAQLRAKFARRGLPAAVPMVPVRVRGIGVGISAHIGRAGYVAGAPYADPRAETELVVSWFDADQLRAVDATEHNYHRIALPGEDFPMTLPSGDPLGRAFLYVSAHGVLAGPDGAPRPGGGDQGTLLAGLLAASAALRQLLGPDPATWVARARADEAVRTAGTRIFREEGWSLPQEAFRRYAEPASWNHWNQAGRIPPRPSAAE